MAIPPLDDFKRFPDMVHWFDPRLLAKLLNNVVTSAMFGKYADRRLMVAALDTVPPEELERRARSLRPILQPNSSDPVWFDFVADLGDGFDSTYAVASLLARPDLTFDELKLPRGQFLLMGGDEVYPLAEADAYQNQLQQPYRWAALDPAPSSSPGVPLFAIPGNHDWYDGLVLFLAYFCREKPSHFGIWRSAQRRSYFAIQITETWWLWAIDIQLADDMDQPQADYFRHIAQAMSDDARIILCSAEPGWLYTDTNKKSWGITDYVIGIAKQAGKNFTIPILLSGDTHHYSRYQAKDGTQFITSGGGGAFLHPTHQLEKHVDLQWIRTKRDLELATKQGSSEPSVYPSMEKSRELIEGNNCFAFTNSDFSYLMAGIYTVIGLLVAWRNEWDIYIIVTLLIGWAFVSYTTDQEKVSILETRKERRSAIATTLDKKDADKRAELLSKNKVKRNKVATVYTASILHSAIHAGMALSAANYFAKLNETFFTLQGEWWRVWEWVGIIAIEMGVVGFFIGSTIFGLNMLITGLYLRMSRNDSFSSLRIGAFNNFLRIRIDGDEAEIHVIGLEEVPRRDDWIDNPNRATPGEPHFIPKKGKELKPHIIETFKVNGAVTPA